ncbi:MAG: 2-nitropropane dioxygenase [Actinomycetospora sp.]|nr:2-nitropropane dioxygenase [Actinomycetospora sp.]
MPRTSFTDLVGCRLPLQQAPMGAISPPALARAVAAAGGLGTIAVPPGGEVPADLAEHTDLPGGVFAVNLVGEDVALATIGRAARHARVVDFFWSWPRRAAVDAVHAEGALASWQVGSLDEARDAVDAGVDLVTVQGRGAGGHVRGDETLGALLAGVVDAVPVPVLAAGGIADGRGLADVLAAGAAGARVGTRLVATPESGAHPEYVAAVLDAGDGATEITDAFAVCPLCATRPTARVLRSAVTAVRGLADEQVGVLSTPHGDVVLTRGHGIPPSRGVSGTVAAMALYAGEGVGAVTEVRPAGEVVAAMYRDADALLAGAVPQPRDPGGRER